MAVVDVLEAVQVEVEQGQGALVALGLVKGLGQAVQAQQPVGQTGEGIVVGQVFGPRLGLLLGGDVAPDDMQLGLVALTDGGEEDDGREALAIGADVFPLELVGAFLLGDAHHRGGLRRGGLTIGLAGGRKVPGGLPDQLLRPLQAQHGQGRRIGGDEVAILDQGQGLTGVLEQAPEAFLALDQGRQSGADLGGAFRDPALQGGVEGAQFLLQLPPHGDVLG